MRSVLGFLSSCPSPSQSPRTSASSGAQQCTAGGPCKGAKPYIQRAHASLRARMQKVKLYGCFVCSRSPYSFSVMGHENALLTRTSSCMTSVCAKRACTLSRHWQDGRRVPLDQRQGTVRYVHRAALKSWTTPAEPSGEQREARSARGMRSVTPPCKSKR